MNIRIKTDTGDEPVTIAKARQFVKHEDDSDTAEITLITDMVAAVRTHIERRTGLSLVGKTYEVFFRWDDKPFILPVSPVISVDKVEKVDYLGTKTELTLNTDYFKKGLYDIEIIPMLGATSDPLRNDNGLYDLLVTFQAGYGDDLTEDCPADILDAMMTQVVQWYENRDDFRELNFIGKVNKIVNTYKKMII